MATRPMTPRDFRSFRDLLLSLQARLRGDVNQMTDEALGDESSVLTHPSQHQAELATETFDQEFTLGLIENDRETLTQIEEALERIEAGTYGTCDGCGKSIARSRLRAIPYAALCITCARAEEESMPPRR